MTHFRHSKPSPRPATVTPPGRRTQRGALFHLVELPPQLVVDGILKADGFEAQDVTPIGAMRETCPHCKGVALQLVLRFGHVIRPHLFCDHCTRCFDATDAHGHSALLYAPVPALI